MKYESILESLLYYSPNFSSIISKIDDPIANDIFQMEGENITQDITFIDIDENGIVTFSQMDKAIKKISSFLDQPNQMDKNFLPLDNIDIYKFDNQGIGPDVYGGNRNQIRIGKLVNKILGNKYSDSQIESFVNKLKSFLEVKFHFNIISGEDIKSAYDVKKYAYIGKGSLGNSCMNTRDFFDLYTKNPEVCRMLILTELKNGENKIVGRALVWKLNSCRGSLYSKNENENLDVEYLMDRIYTSDDYLEHKFTDYAKKQGWAHKTYQRQSYLKSITYKSKLYESDMTVKVKKGEYKVYPYMDTFTRLDIRTGTLYNDRDNKKPGHILTSTQGTFWDKYYPNLVRRFRDFVGM